MRTSGMAVLVLLALAACARSGPQVGNGGADGEPTSVAMAEPTGPQRYRFVGTILESPQHGPQLCTVVATSYPPQCGGPDVLGWDWSAVTAESSGGTTWGNYEVVGAWDGTAFTLTEPATPPKPRSAPTRTAVDFSAPCPEPPGGWAPVDADRATDADLQAARLRAQQDPGYAGLWVDQRGRSDNDPARLVLVVGTTADQDALATEMREVWGGALCVTGARYTDAELNAARDALSTAGGFSELSTNEVDNTVEVVVWLASRERQAEYDARFGPGLVRQISVLQPVS